ncbi:MAG: creatininase family protein [Anaerolineae bacterium]
MIVGINKGRVIMQWENLTSSDFAQAVQRCRGVGIIPIGVLEAHASHLPLGTDMFTAHFSCVDLRRCGLCGRFDKGCFEIIK